MGLPQVARFGDLIRKMFSIKGSVDGEVIYDFQPNFDLLTDKPELIRLRGEVGFLGGGIGLGAVGLSGRVWLMNKLPGMLVVVDQISVGSRGVVPVVRVDLTTVGLPADGAGGQSTIEGTDSRDGFGTPGTTPKVGTTVANDATGAPSGVVLLAGTGRTLRTRWVLKTGYALVVSGDQAGAGNDIVASFDGYERSIEPSEAF